MLNIKDFFTSIQEELLNKRLRFAQKYIDITSKDIEIIYHARKSLLFDEKDTWMKKQSGLFDVTMRAYDGAEVCELVGPYQGCKKPFYGGKGSFYKKLKKKLAKTP